MNKIRPIWLNYPRNDFDNPDPQLWRDLTVNELLCFCPERLSQDFVLTRETYGSLSSRLWWAKRDLEFHLIDTLEAEVLSLRHALYEQQIIVYEHWVHSEFFIPCITFVLIPSEANNG